jgi:hypothetical protein
MKYRICHFIKYALGIAFLVVFFSNIADAVVSLESLISVGNTYSDNIDLTPENKEYDYITTLSPEFNLNIADRFYNLSLFYSPAYATYLRFPENNTLRQNASVEGSRQITRTTRLEFSDGFLYTEDPAPDTGDINYDADTTVRQGRAPYTTNTAAIGVVNQFGPEDSIALDYEYYFLNNDDPTIEDSNSHRPGVMMTYWLVPNQYGTESEFRYTKWHFDDSGDFDDAEDYNDILGRIRLIRRLSPHFEIYFEYNQEFVDYVSDGEDDYKVYSPLAGFVWDEYINYSLSASFGYFFRENDHGGSDSGPLGTIASLYTWEQGSSVSISGVAGYDQASGDAEDLGFNPFYEVESIADCPLSRHLSGNLFAAYRWNIYTDETPDRNDTLWRTGAGLIYEALPWMIVEMNYIYRKVNSNVDTDDYVENRAEIIVTIAPRQSLMLFD